MTVNLSLTMPDDPAIVDAVREAAQAGVDVVMAAGNDGAPRPSNVALARAGFPNTVLVGALDAAGRPWKGTNRPQPLHPQYRYVRRRGSNVPTSAASGATVTGTGTSFAAPLETAHLLTAVG